MPELDIDPGPILTGVEFEVQIRNNEGSRVGRNWPTLFPNVIDENRRVGGWVVKHEDPMGSEFTYAGPLPYSEFLPRMEELFHCFDRLRIEYGCEVEITDDCGMHVHVNATPDLGAAAPKLGLIEAYFDTTHNIQGAWWETVASPEDRPEDYCYARRSSGPTEVYFDSKGFDITANCLGTIEIRTWDSTFDWDLITRRNVILGDFIRLGMQIPIPDNAIDPEDNDGADDENYDDRCGDPDCEECNGFW